MKLLEQKLGKTNFVNITCICWKDLNDSRQREVTKKIHVDTNANALLKYSDIELLINSDIV